MNIILRTILLLIALVFALYGLAVVNKLMDESFQRKFNLDQFDKIFHQLDPCWTQLRKVSLFAACAAGDDSLLSDISFLFTSCLFEQHNIPAIQCRSMSTAICDATSCSRKCASQYSLQYFTRFNYSAFDVLHAGLDKLCRNYVYNIGPEHVWSMGMPWENIILSLTGASGNGTMVSTDSLENYRVLTNVLRTALYEENPAIPFVLSNK